MAALVAAFAAMPSAARATELIGMPQVLDGDTLVMAGVKIRFDGIDAGDRSNLSR